MLGSITLGIDQHSYDQFRRNIPTKVLLLATVMMDYCGEAPSMP